MTRDDGVLHETGIRTLRRKPVFTTPNVFPPESTCQRPEVRLKAGPGAWPASIVRAPALLRLQESTTQLHHFYDQLCPAVRRAELPQAHRARGSARARRAADRRARQDRLPGGLQAAALRRARSS